MVSLQPRAGYCFSSVYRRGRRGSEVSTPPKVTQQVAAAGRGLRDSQRLSRPAPPLTRGRSLRLPTVRATPLGGGMGVLGREAPLRVRVALQPGSQAGRSIRLRTAASSQRLCALSVPHKVHLPETSEAPGARGAWCRRARSLPLTVGSHCAGAGFGDLVPLQPRIVRPVGGGRGPHLGSSDLRPGEAVGSERRRPHLSGSPRPATSLRRLAASAGPTCRAPRPAAPAPPPPAPPRPAPRRTPRPEEAARRAAAEGRWWHGGAAAATLTVAPSEPGRCSECGGPRTPRGAPRGVTRCGGRGPSCAARTRGGRQGERAGGGAGSCGRARPGAQGAPGGGAAGPDRGSRRRGGSDGEDVAAAAAPCLGGDSEVHPGAE